jgi:hypothetical protein
MGLFDSGKLEKMTIRAYRTIDQKGMPQTSDAPEDTYVAQVNPSSYTLNRLLHYSRHQGQGFSSSEAVYSQSEPVTLQFEFLFDGTGVVPPPSELGDIPLVGAIASALSGDKPYVVMDEIEKFNRLVHDYVGKHHRPNQLLLVWGSLVFPCVLNTLTYRFTLFKPDGTPLRAVASCSFCEHKPDAQRVRHDNASSPDLTHLRDIREGDTLPALAYDIYGRPELYLEVARANKLVNFRRLRPASRVAFPPLAAQEKT